MLESLNKIERTGGLPVPGDTGDEASDYAN
jgi:hypothetical protein